MKTLILMIQFFTRIPIPYDTGSTEADFAKGPAWFPTVGWIIGGILAAAAYGLVMYRVDPLLTALLLVILEVLVTGGLHLDGLADSFDGLYSNRDRGRILEIMKDSRIGTNGVLALMGALSLKTLLLAQFTSWQLIAAVAVMPVLGRLNITLASQLGKPARPDGMGNLFIGKVTNGMVLWALLTALLPLAFMPERFPYVAFGTILFSFAYRKHVEGILGGITGDILGAMVELTEILYLGLALCIWNWM